MKADRARRCPARCADARMDHRAFIDQRRARTLVRSSSPLAFRGAAAGRTCVLVCRRRLHWGDSIPLALRMRAALGPERNAISALAVSAFVDAALVAAAKRMSDWYSPGSGPRISTPRVGTISLNNVMTIAARPAATLSVAAAEPGARMILGFISMVMPIRSNIFSIVPLLAPSCG